MSTGAFIATNKKTFLGITAVAILYSAFGRMLMGSGTGNPAGHHRAGHPLPHHRPTLGHPARLRRAHRPLGALRDYRNPGHIAGGYRLHRHGDGYRTEQVRFLPLIR